MSSGKDDLLEIKAIGKEGTYDALYQFASTLTTKVRELEASNRRYEIGSNQVTTILHSMIESFVHAAVRTGVAQEYNRFDVIPKSDGYHTLDELYEFRKAYNALIFNEWAEQGRFNVHKSQRHSDGKLCFGGGWFVVSAQTSAGQITNHYRLDDWSLFDCPERARAVEWDGHTSQQALDRLLTLARGSGGRDRTQPDPVR
jgi:hypothetical protein